MLRVVALLAGDGTGESEEVVVVVDCGWSVGDGRGEESAMLSKEGCLLCCCWW